jgi:hypothetical protein
VCKQYAALLFALDDSVPAAAWDELPNDKIARDVATLIAGELVANDFRRLGEFRPAFLF